MADIKLIDAQGDERTYSGVAKVKIPLADGTGNATFIQPAGKKELTGTNEVDVTNFATAQVVDKNLIAENIKSGVSILGVKGTHEGGGETPYYDGTVIIEKAESVFGLRRFKETVDTVGSFEFTEVTDYSAYLNEYDFDIEPIVDETADGTEYITKLSCAYTVLLGDGETYACTLAKVEENGNTVIAPIPISRLLEETFNILSTANSTVDEWLLANTEGVSV